MAKSQYAREIVHIAEGRALSLGKARNRAISWGQLGKELSEPTRTPEKFAAFLRLPKEEQDKLKAIGGWILAGSIEGDRRKRKAVTARDIITFDCDEISPELVEEIKVGVNPLCDYEFYAHSTRKHSSEVPRVRFYILCSTPVEPEQYDAVARILAEKLDPSLDSIDDVSFRLAQMMFKPTVSKDQEFLFWHNPGKRVSPGEVLSRFRSDWRDYTNLPYSDKRGQRRKTAEKAEDPTQKHGIVGAFCRAYDVEAAMDHWIPGVYLPGDSSGAKPRYSYSDGTTSNGVVVEDDGLFIYSHHGSDPCGERLCNAFDMVRIHKFGALDKDLPENTAPKEWPSYKALTKLAQEDDAIRAELLADRVDINAMFDDISDDEDLADDLRESDGDLDIEDAIREVLAPSRGAGLPAVVTARKPKKPAKNWPQKSLELDLQGGIKPTVPNIATIIMNDPRLWGAIGRNTFSNKITARRSIASNLEIVPKIEVEDTVNGLEWNDLHDVSIRAILEYQSGTNKPGWGLRVTDRDLHAAILLVAQRWAFHPAQEYYLGLTWDGVPRAESLFIDYLGCPDTPYYRQTAKLFLLAAVCRVFNPGHKWDHAPILSGDQGIGKSTFIKSLVGAEWAGELTAHMASDKDAVEQMLGKLMLELPELANMRKSEAEDVKQFLTLIEDRVRLAYDRRMSSFRRQCVFVGTTNAKEYLKDPTGNRRFWPIEVQRELIDNPGLAASRNQIWAEVVHWWRQLSAVHGYRNIPLVLTGEAAATARALQDLAREENSSENSGEAIRDWLDTPVPLSQIGADPRTAGFDEMEGEPLVVRTVTCARECYVHGLGGTLERLSGNRTLEQTISSAMQYVEGWKKTGTKRRFIGYGNCKSFCRLDATRAEVETGYRVVGRAGTIDSDEGEDVL